ncbi:MAG: RIP metalloprotease RseP [Planctomycetaceae bacterium]|nr:RIP metalloprotease RseP [Planctomycetaceae bacterium]
MDIQLVPVLAALKPGAILITALGLGLVIFFHELGHFLVAKWCGVYVERFSIGFGSPILSRKWGETEYVLGWLPLGGYVKMRGQDDMDPGEMTDEEIAEDPRSYTAKTVPQRMAIISAGVIMNIITGMMFFMIAFHHGVKTVDRVIGGVQVGSPAWTHGIRSGDEILRMNDRPVHDYSDIMLNTALSRGTVTIEGRHLDGSEFSISLDPEKENKSKRTIGVLPTESLQLPPQEYLDDDNPLLAYPGSAASDLDLKPGDEITSVNGVKVGNYVEFLAELSKHASEEVTLDISRTDAKSKSKSNVELKLSSEAGRELGFRVSMGKVDCLQIDGVAAKAGIKVGDRIAKVDGLVVENDLDPFLLTEYFSEHAGQEVVVEVFRETEGSGGSKVEITLVPNDRPAWAEPPTAEDSPLAIPSIGLGYRVASTVFAVNEGGPAASAGIEERDTITSVSLILEDGKKDLFADESKYDIDVKNNNWAFAYWMIQTAARSRQIELTVTKAGGTKETVKITPVDSSEWYVQDTRGIRFMAQTSVRKAETISEAFSMSSDFTMGSIRQVYLTLRGLITQDISIKLMSGPIGIAQAAYATAETGLPQFMQFLGLISINLAVVNFLPIPVLDGGHMVLLLWEGITRKKPSEKVVGIATWIGLILLLTLIATVVFLDLFVDKV